MSESLPYSGVAIVDVIRYAVVTQACSESPCRSSPMVRIAVATMVWSRAARNMPIISPPRIVRIWRWVMLNVSAAEAGMAGPLVAVGEVTGSRYFLSPTVCREYSLRAESVVGQVAGGHVSRADADRAAVGWPRAPGRPSSGTCPGPGRHRPGPSPDVCGGERARRRQVTGGVGGVLGRDTCRSLGVLEHAASLRRRGRRRPG